MDSSLSCDANFKARFLNLALYSIRVQSGYSCIIWDALDHLCDGGQGQKKNRRQILTAAKEEFIFQNPIPLLLYVESSLETPGTWGDYKLARWWILTLVRWLGCKSQWGIYAARC